MSRESAKAHYTRQAGDPDTGWISDQDARQALDTVYDDLEVPAGTNGHVLTADNTQPRGMKWAAPTLPASAAAALEDLTARVAALEGSGGTPPSAPLFPYGSAIGTDTIANLILGIDQHWVSQRFRAEITGTPVSHRWVTKIGVNYSDGDHGTIRVSLMADDGTGKPYGPELDGYTVTRPPATVHTDWPFDNRNATLTAGNIYHLVFHNIDTAPDSNYCSVNNILVFSPQAGMPRQPRYPDTDLAVLVKPVSTNTWTVADQYTPTFDLTYSTGWHQGQGYVDMQSAGGSLISGNSMIRERFTVTGSNRTASTVWVRLAKHTGTGDLTVRLEDAGGSLIDSATIPAASIPQDTAGAGEWVVGPPLQTGDEMAGKWVSGTFSQPRTLQVGQTYNLRLSCNGSTQFWMRLLEQGYANGYSAGHFDDGWAQVSTDGGTSWSDTPAWINSGQGDLQFYLA